MSITTSLFFCALLALILAGNANAHEIRPAIANVEVTQEATQLSVRMSVEPILAGADLAGITDTDQSPLSERIDTLRAQSPEEIARLFREAWPQIRNGIFVYVDGDKINPELIGVDTQPEPDIKLPRDSTFMFTAPLPANSAPVVIGWAAEYGPLIVRQIADVEAPYSAYLSDGALSDPIPRTGKVQTSAMDLFIDYVVIGFEHIIPKGLDHILFVLGLFFFALNWKALVLQISAFTLAHTVTLALATLGIVSVPSAVVEPLIAASIIYVAIENVVQRSITVWRTVIVFAFGLLHGLGFASVLGDVGLEPTRFVTGLIGFNVGVELGQLAVIAIAFLVFGLPFGKQPWYRKRVALPASFLIALTGAFWFFERVLG